jgi:predicted amidohydrolase
MLKAIDEAADAGARLLATPECAVTGYPSAARQDCSGMNLCGIADWEDRLLMHAERRGIALVLGSIGIHPDGGTGPTVRGGGAACALPGQALPALANEAVVGGVVPAQRYRKRCLTPTDRHHFQPGRTALSFELDGLRIGVVVCFDLRFPDVIADLAAAGCEAIVAIAHMAGPDADPGSKAHLIPAFVSVRAAEYAMPILFCNTAADDRWLDSGLWDGRGLPQERQAEGLMLAELQPSSELGDWYQSLRRMSLERRMITD